MKKLWSDRAWDDYLYWQMQEEKKCRLHRQKRSVQAAFWKFYVV